MKIANYIVADGYHRGRQRGTFYAQMDDICIFELKESVPLIIENSGCAGLAIPYEFHVSANGTTVFFTLVDEDVVTDKLKTALYRVYCLTHNIGTPRKVDSDTVRTGMDAATRLLTGEARSARRIGRDAQRDSFYDDDDDDDIVTSKSIYDLMREANPDDPTFR